MWVFTNFGFYSIVKHNQKPDVFLVRARSKEDLLRLIYKYGDICNLNINSIIVNDEADYRYRLEINKSSWSDVISKIADDINYTNFKNSVKDNLDEYRAELCNQVWDVMYDLQATEK